MALTPQDIVRKEFREAFRGYNQTDVDLFLDELVEELTRLSDENQKMRVRLAALQQELGRFRDSRSSRATAQMASRYAELAPEEPRTRPDAAPAEPRIEPLGGAEPPRSEPARSEPVREPWPARSEPPRPATPPPPPVSAPRPVTPPQRPAGDPFGARVERPAPTPPVANDPFRSDAPLPPRPSEPAAEPPPQPEHKTEPHRPVTERWTPPEDGGSFWDRG